MTKNYIHDMPAASASTADSSRKAVLTGRIISGLIIAFMVLDGGMKLVPPKAVTDSFVKLGWDPAVSTTLGAVLLACTALYAFRRTAVLGAILLTGYFGGAVAVNVGARQPVFNICFAIVFGILTWAGLYLRDARIRALIPLRGE